MPEPRPPAPDVLRLATRVAILYHDRAWSQQQIAARFGLSPARVSRLLKQAAQLGIVRTTVSAPAHEHAGLEQALERCYGIDELIVVDAPEAAQSDDGLMGRALADRTARYLELMLPTLAVVGVSSWSATLLAAVQSMRPLAGSHEHQTRAVVQLLGGVGQGPASQHATRLTEHMARLAQAEPVFMLVPGLLATPEDAHTLRADPACRQAMACHAALSALLTGVGALEPSSVLRDSGHALPAPDLAALQAAGAVGDVCLRFFDERGQPVRTALDARVLGIATQQIRRTRRRIGVAGGRRKFDAVRGALRGGWLSTLITDLHTAERLLAQP